MTTLILEFSDVNLAQYLFHEKSLVSQRIIFQCRKNFITQVFIERTCLITERIKVSEFAAALTGNVFERKQQLFVVSTPAQIFRQPHQSNLQPVPVDLAPHAAD